MLRFGHFVRVSYMRFVVEMWNLNAAWSCCLFCILALACRLPSAHTVCDAHCLCLHCFGIAAVSLLHVGFLMGKYTCVVLHCCHCCLQLLLKEVAAARETEQHLQQMRQLQQDLIHKISVEEAAIAAAATAAAEDASSSTQRSTQRSTQGAIGSTSGPLPGRAAGSSAIDGAAGVAAGTSAVGNVSADLAVVPAADVAAAADDNLAMIHDAELAVKAAADVAGAGVTVAGDADVARRSASESLDELLGMLPELQQLTAEAEAAAQALAQGQAQLLPLQQHEEGESGQ
jgi:hypothetical protein